MSTENNPPATVTHNGRTLTLDQTPDGETVWTDGARQYVPLERAKAMAAKAASAHDLTALKAQWEAEARPRWESEHLAPVRQQLRATEARFAIAGAGLIDDDESRAEIMDRYDRSPVGTEGQRPSLPDWLRAQKEGGARWLKAHMPEVTTTPATPSVVTPPKPAAPVSNPNGGATPQPPPIAGKSVLDDYATLPMAERLRLREQAIAEAVARGEIAAPRKS
jgi:hypothetical protein